MNIGGRTIDHIVYGVHDLDQAIIDIEKKLGIAPVFGGYHTTQGTKNALLRLGDKCYLELLAVDSDNLDVKGNRWMGIDLLTQPQVIRWALKSDNLESDSQIVNAYNPEMGVIEGGERRTTTGGILRWGIAMPLAKPEIDIVPFMTDWSESSAHPTDTLKQECKLLEISFGHPDPAQVEVVLSLLSMDIDVTVSNSVSIRLQIECPRGIVEI